MKNIKIILILIVIALFLAFPLVYTGFSVKEEQIRKPVFAGTWYPSEETELNALIEEYLNNSEQLEINGKIKAIIVPHAGYVYSGQIAATAFKQLKENYKNVFLIGPSHRYPLEGISISNFKYYSTPLGKIKVSKKAREMLNEKEISNIEKAHEQEHSLEIELPFLQKSLKDFEIIPILVGKTDIDKFAEILKKYYSKDDLILVSVDLSHYHEYLEAIQIDSNSLNKILTLNEQEILYSKIDAPWAVSSILKIAKENSWKPYLISYANSGDITGEKESVVGYSSIIFVEEFSEEEKEFLLNLAEKSAEKYLKKGEKIEISLKKVPENLRKERGCFVTFKKDGKLRGCIGHIFARKPLYECVIENSINAAVNDIRFNPISYEELKESSLEISVLSSLELLEYENSEELLNKLKAFEHGVVLKRGNFQSTYLPVVWKQIPDKVLFLNNLCLKAGIEKECWKDSKTEIYVYTAENFSQE